MNFVCLVFELGDKTLTLSPMENLMVKCNLHEDRQDVIRRLDHPGYVRVSIFRRAFVVFSNGKNGTIGRQIPFKVLPMVPLVMPLVPMVPMLPTYGSKRCRQTTAWAILQTREKSRDSIWRA